jgi:hypothetical protein
MPEEQFDQNFVWYEWSFVSPGQVPSDDLGESAADRPAGAGEAIWDVVAYNHQAYARPGTGDERLWMR